MADTDEARDSSPAQRELARILQDEPEIAGRLRTEPASDSGQPIHRTKLWVYSTGRGKPNVETAAFIERVTDGRVKANAWVEPPVSTSEPAA